MSESSPPPRPSEAPKRPEFAGIIRAPKEEDLAALQSILEVWLCDSETKKQCVEEIHGVLERVRESMTGKNNYHYLVAEEGEEVLGMVGFRPVEDERMKPFAETDNPAEFINAYVAPAHRAGRKIGQTLVTNLEQVARAAGFTEMLFNSGPRYKETAWKMYDRLLGPSVGILKDFYGPGLDAPVWRKAFKKE